MDERWDRLTTFKALTGFGSDKMQDVGIVGFLIVLAVSLLCSLLVAHLYRHFYAKRSSGSQIHRAFPLLGISITAIFITIQFSLPLSLGLLGALSIVRFRTPIKEPEEIGFLMLVVSTSLGCATFNFLFVGLVLGVAIVALFLLDWGILSQPQDEGVILINLPLDQHRSNYSQLVELLDAKTSSGRVESVSKTNTGAVISYSFKGVRKGSLGELQAGLDNLIELVDNASYDLFVNQQRVL